jgi:hypothetical protein
MKKHDDDKHDDDKDEKPAAAPKHEDAKDKRIRELTETLEFLKDNAVQGNVNHVARIEAVLRG